MNTIVDQARATLKRLLELKLQPTPDNYRRVFDSLHNGAAAPSAEAADRGGDLQRLIEQWERSQQGLSQLQKRQQLARLDSLPSTDARGAELAQLLDRWSALPARSASQSASLQAATSEASFSESEASVSESCATRSVDAAISAIWPRSVSDDAAAALTRATMLWIAEAISSLDAACSSETAARS